MRTVPISGPSRIADGKTPCRRWFRRPPRKGWCPEGTRSSHSARNRTEIFAGDRQNCPGVGHLSDAQIAASTSAAERTTSDALTIQAQTGVSIHPTPPERNQAQILAVIRIQSSVQTGSAVGYPSAAV